MDSEPRTVWRMRSGLLTSWTLLIIVTAVLGFIGFILLQRNLSWQTPPDLTQVVFGGGLALLGTGVVVGLWIWVLRVTLVSRRYGDAELELTNVPTRLLRRKRFSAGHFVRSQATGSSYDKWMVSLERPGTKCFGGLVVAIVATESEARWLVAELSRALHHAT